MVSSVVDKKEVVIRLVVVVMVDSLYVDSVEGTSEEILMLVLEVFTPDEK